MPIQGVQLIGIKAMRAPVVGVLARAKSGKSVLPILLKDWPKPGNKPLVLAFDDTGPYSAAKLGHPLDGIIIKEQPGTTLQAKMFGVLQRLEQQLKTSPEYSSLVVDCTSTMAEHLFHEIVKANPNPDDRDSYKKMNNICKNFFWRICDLGLPSAWIAWLAEPAVHEKRQIPGGPQIPGEGFKKMFAGACHALVLLEKRVAMPNDPPEFICSDGQARLFHTRSWGGVDCEARFALPEPMPANLAWLFHYIMQPTVGQVQSA